jgi:hypothetical protein
MIAICQSTTATFPSLQFLRVGLPWVLNPQKAQSRAHSSIPAHFFFFLSCLTNVVSFK